MDNDQKKRDEEKARPKPASDQPDQPGENKERASPYEKPKPGDVERDKRDMEPGETRGYESR